MGRRESQQEEMTRELGTPVPRASLRPAAGMREVRVVLVVNRRRWRELMALLANA